jgi:sugar-specific transcriptional regulator TrmB
MLEEGEVQLLTELGLTGRQARIFLVLLKYESSTARALAIASNLARQDTYKVLDELQELGLVERQISAPAKFAAITIHDALSILINRKVKQTSDLEEKTRIIIDSLKTQNAKTTEDEKPKLFLIPEGETFILKIRKAIDNTQKTIDIATSSRNITQAMYFLLAELQRAMGRGVKTRCLTDMLEVEDSQQKTFGGLLENSSFEVRTLPNHSKTWFCIYDKKEVSAVLSPLKDFAKSPLLWSNCTSLVEEYQDHYNMMWDNAACNTQWSKKNPADNNLSKALGKVHRRQAIQGLSN